ncbi:predicted protein [Naegleria gruberi]|uniref:Predicted protein n=1 Tax=Naegleria gruberi TaxID=5762 RepID=D2UXK5_NAEGR|nr:uncharacterized protein NAEGRDRAFT_61157 [Naegleria gruberi]EFC50648.1 predicted protein [Naegleria gruberi]|eukprot:XP_002683392.1 predicted protein [Naegleria gruberi strain NEG-M]
MSGKIFSIDSLEILKSTFEDILQVLLQEREAFEAGVCFGSHCEHICLKSLESLSGLLRKYEISWIDIVKEHEIFLSLIFSKNFNVRESIFSIISNGLHTKETFGLLEKSNPKLVELIVSKLSSADTDIVKDQCIWIICKYISLSSEPLNRFLECIPFPQLFNLGDRNLESVTALIYQLLLRDPSSQSKVLFENSSLNYILQKLEDVAYLGTISYNSLENLLKVVKKIIQNNNDIASYLIRDTTLVDNIQKIVGTLLTVKKTDKLIELAFCIMNNLVAFAKNDDLSLEYLKTRENTLKIISATLQSSLSINVNITVSKYVTTLIGRKCFPYNSELGENEYVMQIVDEIQRLYYSSQDNFFANIDCEECFILGKSLSWILNIYTTTKEKVQESIIESNCTFNRKIVSSLSIDFMHTSRSEKCNSIDKLKHQLVLNLSIFQHLFLSNHAKKVSNDFNLFQDLKYIWFSDFTDSEIRLSLLYVYLNMVTNCERSKLEFAKDINKNKNNSLLLDIVSGSLSAKSKLTNSHAYFMLLSSLISTGEVRYSMLKYGLVDKIINGLKEIFIKKKDDTRMEYCLKLLSHLSFFEDCHESFLQSDTIDHLFEQFEKSPNEAVKEYLVIIFRNLLFCRSMSTLILRVEELCVLVLKIATLLKGNTSIMYYSANLMWTYLSLYVDVSC